MCGRARTSGCARGFSRGRFPGMVRGYFGSARATYRRWTSRPRARPATAFAYPSSEPSPASGRYCSGFRVRPPPRLSSLVVSGRERAPSSPARQVERARGNARGSFIFGRGRDGRQGSRGHLEHPSEPDAPRDIHPLVTPRVRARRQRETGTKRAAMAVASERRRGAGRIVKIRSGLGAKCVTTRWT